MPVFSFEDVTNAVSASYEQSSIVAFTQHMPATAETFAAASPAAQRSSPPRSPPPQPVPRGSPARIVGGSRGGSRGGRPARGPGSRGGRIRAPRAGRVSSRGGRAAVVSTRGGRAGSRGRGGFAFPGDVLDTSFVGTDFPAAVDADNDPDDYYDFAETYEPNAAVPPDWGIQPDAFIQGDYLVTYSFYIGKPNADAPDEWWEPLKAFLAQWSPRFLVAREKGEKKGLIHYQGVADLPLHSDKTFGAAFRLWLKRSIGADYSGASKMGFKPAEPNQSFLLLSGYCLKDKGASHHTYYSAGMTRRTSTPHTANTWYSFNHSSTSSGQSST
jgi:hypothetical protein